MTRIRVFLVAALAFTLQPELSTWAADPGPDATDEALIAWVRNAVGKWVSAEIPAQTPEDAAASDSQRAMAEGLRGLAIRLRDEAESAAPLADVAVDWPSSQTMQSASRPDRRRVLADAGVLLRKQAEHLRQLSEQFSRADRLRESANQLGDRLSAAYDYAVLYEHRNDTPRPRPKPLEEIADFPTWITSHWSAPVAAWTVIAEDAIDYDLVLARRRTPDEHDRRSLQVFLDHAPSMPRVTGDRDSDLKAVSKHLLEMGRFIGAASRIVTFQSASKSIAASGVEFLNRLRPVMLARCRRTLDRARELSIFLSEEARALALELRDLDSEREALSKERLRLDMQRTHVDELRREADRAQLSLQAGLDAQAALEKRHAELKQLASTARDHVAKAERALGDATYSCPHGHSTASECPDQVMVASYYHSVVSLERALHESRMASVEATARAMDAGIEWSGQRSENMALQSADLQARARHLEELATLAPQEVDWSIRRAIFRERLERNTAESRANQQDAVEAKSLLDGDWERPTR